MNFSAHEHYLASMAYMLRHNSVSHFKYKKFLDGFKFIAMTQGQTHDVHRTVKMIQCNKRKKKAVVRMQFKLSYKQYTV